MFIDNLIDKIKEKNNPSVVGLDPVLEYVPKYLVDKCFKIYGKNLKGAAEAIWEFNKEIMDNVFDIVPIVKLQVACYEMYGIEGIKVFDRTIKYAKDKGLLVIADGKRNDIGSSAKCYSKAFLGSTKIDEDMKEEIFNVDCLTVNPYLGIDGIEPFLEDCFNHNKGIFVLVKTSNPSSFQLQDLKTDDEKFIYEKVAELVNNWGGNIKGKYGYSSVGAVVGATYPEQAKMLRKVMKNSYFLVPGFGAQGGTSKDVENCFNEDNLGAIINASRSIMCAYKNELYITKYEEIDFALASREEAIRMRDEINQLFGGRI